MVIRIKVQIFCKKDELQSNYLATIPASWKWVLQRKALLTISREKNSFLSIKRQMLKHMNRKSKSTRGTCTHIKSAQAEMEIVKLSERTWENRLKNKNTFTFSGKGWRSLCVSLPQASLVSLSPVCLQLSSYHNHLHRTQLQPSTASHVSLTHTHTHVSTSHHTPLPARHITPHTQCLHTLRQPHDRAERELKPLGLRLGLAQSERLMSRDRPHRGPYTSCWGQDVTRATWPTHHTCLVLKHIYPKQCLTLRLKPSWDLCVSVLSILCSCPCIVKYSQRESE